MDRGLASAALILLGGYGAITSLKYRERYELHISQAMAMRHRLDTMYPQLRLEEGRRASQAAHRQRYPALCRKRLHTCGPPCT